MIQNKLSFLLIALSILFSCNRDKKIQQQGRIAADTVQHKPNDKAPEPITIETFAIPDTIKKSDAYFFSDNAVKDSFVLTINPGKISGSKSVLQIITAAGKVIYSETFDSASFIKDITNPDIFLPNGITDTDAYIKKYYASLTPAQIAACFKKSVSRFFKDDYIYFLKDTGEEFFNGWDEEITEKDFLHEVTADPSIRLCDISCFDCEEGGTIIGYSRKQGKVIALLDHD